MNKTNMENLEETVKDLMGREDRKDAEFRYVILSTEIGDIGRYITHDSKLNPGARPYGSRDDEILAYGQAFAMLMALSSLRKISVQEALDKGMANWKDADWRKREAASRDKIRGRSACLGYAAGKAYVLSEENKLEDFEKGIIVAAFAAPDIAPYLKKAQACVTDHGGSTCHLALIAREYNTPCIVGCGNATSLIKHGQKVIVDAKPETGKVLYD